MNAARQRNLEAAVTQELQALERCGGVQIDMDPGRMMALIGAAQLALRHPAFAQRPSAGYLREWIKGVQEQLREAEYPNIADVIELGFDAKFDV